MSDDVRLPDEVVRWHADSDYRYRHARLSLTTEQLIVEQDALAREVWEMRQRRCNTCFRWDAYWHGDNSEIGRCSEWSILTSPHHYCARWEATPGEET